MSENYYYDNEVNEGMRRMVGEVFHSVRTEEDALIFESDIHTYTFEHSQFCCENVYIEDISGDLKDLEGVPIVTAEEVSSEDEPPFPGEYVPESYTWTFYKFSTMKGDVTVRFFGESNGYYSERVSLHVTTKEDDA